MPAAPETEDPPQMAAAAVAGAEPGEAAREAAGAAPGAWVSTRAGRHLAGRTKVSTAPEVTLRRAVHAAGGRFRLHPRLAKGCTPDFVLPRRRVAVFVDGCYWHSCPAHGRRRPFTGPNAALWEDKMRRNAERDLRSTALAEDMGWVVVRVWEHEVRQDPSGCAARVLGAGSG